MKTSNFAKVNKDVLVEYIYDDDNFIAEDYKIILDTIHETKTFSQDPEIRAGGVDTNNTTDHSLFLLDEQENTWGKINTEEYQFIQTKNFAGNIPQRYDIIKFHFPLNFNFDDNVGFQISIRLWDMQNERFIYLSNYYFDKTDTNRSFEFSSPPFLFQERLWGKYLEIQIPSPYKVSRDVNQPNFLGGHMPPRLGTINHALSTDNIGISTTSPVFLDFRFLENKETVFNRTTFLVSDPFTVTFPQQPEFENLGVKIQPANNGDFFEIFGTFNNNINDFNLFLREQELNGHKKYIIYTVNEYEKNTLTKSVDFFVENNFLEPITYRPIITNSTTTAYLRVNMKVIDTINDSFITRNFTYVFTQEEVGKYGRNLTKINVSNAFSPQIFNAKPENLNVLRGAQKERGEKQKIKVPFPVAVDRNKVLAKNKSEDVNEDTFWGLGQLQIMLYPSDNVVTFAIAREVDNENGVQPFEIPESGTVLLRFKSTNQQVDVPLFYDLQEGINLKKGIVTFRITENQMNTISEIRKNGFDQFYIILKSENTMTTTLYAGFYNIFNQF